MNDVTDLDAEPIDPELRACIKEAASLPGARVIKRKGHLFLKTKRGREILCAHLFAAKQRWIETGIEQADLPDEDKWKIFCLLVGAQARLEHVPGIGLKVTLPPCARH